MTCEHCEDKEATVHLTQVIDGQVKKLHLRVKKAHIMEIQVNGGAET